MNKPIHNCIDEDKLLADIEKFGWTVLMVPASEYLPSFAYTVGLWKNYKHPELISFGLSIKTLHSILNIGGEIIKSGKSILVNKNYSNFFENGSAQFLKVDNRNIADYFGYAIWFSKEEAFSALQLVWTDRNNKFPWDIDFEKEFEKKQPLLDRNADFKFIESKSLAVFTTKQLLELRKPILRVIHEQDGDWQFLTGDQMPEDIRVVGLEEIISIDNTLNDLFNLDFGEEAERSEAGKPWIRKTFENNSE